MINLWEIWLDLHARRIDHFLDRWSTLIVRPGLRYYVSDQIRLTAGYDYVRLYPAIAPVGDADPLVRPERDTIRFYEKQGLIAVGRKERRFNNYKEYSTVTLRRLQQIKRIKGFGFTLNETAEFLDMVENNQASCGNVSEKMAEKVALIDQKIAQLLEIKALMIGSVEKCLHDCAPTNPEENCPILVSDTFSFPKI